jgi:hypothetical protein
MYAFKTGAPANTIDMTTAGVPLAPNASRTERAGGSANSCQQRPCDAPGVKLRSSRASAASGASTAVKVGDPHAEKGLVSSVHRVLHSVWPSGGPIQSPTSDCHQREEKPCRAVGGGWVCRNYLIHIFGESYRVELIASCSLSAAFCGGDAAGSESRSVRRQDRFLRGLLNAVGDGRGDGRGSHFAIGAFFAQTTVSDPRATSERFGAVQRET